MLHQVIGRVVWLTASQELLLKHTAKMCAQWEAEKLTKQQKEDMDNLYAHLRRMEDRDKRYPAQEKLRASFRKAFLSKCAPKYHAYEYTDFDFEFEGNKYHYNNGDITLIEDIEVFDWELSEPF